MPSFIFSLLNSGFCTNLNEIIQHVKVNLEYFVGAQILKVNKRIENSLPHISSKFKIKALVSTSFIRVFLQNVFSFPPASKPVIYSIITEIGHKFWLKIFKRVIQCFKNGKNHMYLWVWLHDYNKTFPTLCRNRQKTLIQAFEVNCTFF